MVTDTAIALNRFGLGARPGEVAPTDPRGWLLAQFARYDPRPPAYAAVLPTPQAIAVLAQAYADRKQDKAAVASVAVPMAASAAVPVTASAVAPAMAAPAPDPFAPVRDAWLAGVGARCNAALASDTPFVENLVHFWANHFALSVEKPEVQALVGAYEAEAIRPHVLGRFSDMLYAVERHPAMLLYLDQAQSIGPDSPAAGGGKPETPAGKPKPNAPHRAGLNENLAREILELHTLGVRSGYTQADVTEFARALTGWTVAGIRPNRALDGMAPGTAWSPRLHEPGPRKIMARTYPDSGAQQAGLILADLSVHPATARHIATKLARHFTRDNPSPALVARLQQAFLASGGDLPTVYRALIEAPEPWEAPLRFRSPWSWGLAAMRACGTQQIDPKQANALFDQIGQPVWKPGSPAGWDDTGASFAAPDALWLRVEAAGRIAGKAGSLDARALAPALFPGALSDATRVALANAETPAQAMTLLLVAPEMLRS